MCRHYTNNPIMSQPNELNTAIQAHLNDAIQKGPLDKPCTVMGSKLHRLYDRLSNVIVYNGWLPHKDGDGFAYQSNYSTRLQSYVGHLVHYQHAIMASGLPFDVVNSMKLACKVSTVTPSDGFASFITQVDIVTEEVTSILAPQSTHEGRRIVETYSSIHKRETIVTDPMTKEEFMRAFPDKCTKVYVVPTDVDWRLFNKPAQWNLVNHTVIDP